MNAPGSVLPPAVLVVEHVAIVLAMPVLMIGLVNRTKSWWGGRRGPGLLQSGWDLLRLLRKRSVVSTVTTPLFRAGAWVVLAASVLAAQIAPVLGPFAPIAFAHDFIVLAYTLGLARLFLMLSALDVGSAFEGMGGAREALDATLALGSDPQRALGHMLGAVRGAGARVGRTAGPVGSPALAGRGASRRIIIIEPPLRASARVCRAA